MSADNQISLKQLDLYSRNCGTLGSLKENERLWIRGNKMSKNRAPDRLIKGAKSPLSKTIHAIITLSLKIIQAIGRLVMGQRVEKNIKKIDVLTDQLSKVLNKELPDATSPDCDHALQKLGKIHLSLTKAQTTGLQEYKKTCELGKASLFKSKKEVRNKRGERVQTLIDRIGDDILSPLERKITELESAVFVKDTQSVKELFTKLQNKEDIPSAALKKTLLSSHAAKEFLYPIYGKPAVDRALEYYHLNEDRVITGKDFYALLTGIAANLTYDDLKTIYDNRSEQIFSPDTEIKFPKETAFEQLTDEQSCAFLARARDLNAKAITPEKKDKYHAQLVQDQVLLECVRRVDEYNGTTDADLPAQDLKKFSFTEYLARDIAYALFDSYKTQFPDGILLPMYDKKGKLCLKQAHSLVSKNGLHGAIIKPMKLAHDQKKSSVQVIFRGTHCRSSLLRDISPGETVTNHFFEGPGRSSFTKHQDTITEGIFKHIDQMAQDVARLKVDVEFMGHSLGGADSQRGLECFTQKLVTRENSPVSGLRLYTYNSPNVETDIARRFVSSVKDAQIPVKLRYFDVHHDPVQEFGVKRLGYCGRGVEKPDNLSVSIFKFNRKRDEKIKALSRNVFSRNKSRMKHFLEAHSFYCLRLHDNEDKEKFNTTVIQDVFSNYSKDLRYHFGEKREKTPVLSEQQDLDKRLVTDTCRAGRDIRRTTRDILNTLSFGYYHPSRRPV